MVEMCGLQQHWLHAAVKTGNGWRTKTMESHAAMPEAASALSLK